MKKALPDDLRIGLLFGGRSGEREVSLSSADTVRSTLLEGGYSLCDIDTGVDNWWDQLTGVDVAFNIQHGPGGEDGVTQGLLRALGVVGTGSGVLGSSLAMDKIRSKQLWRALELPTADFRTLSPDTDFATLIQRWGSAFVKPAREGSSLGMARVDNAEDFRRAYHAAAALDGQVLAEQFIDGPEYTVAILGDRALPPIRIEAANEFYDYDAKYIASSTDYHIPCGLPAEREEAMCQLALDAFAALGCSVWGRVDLMCDSRGHFQLLEINTIPGMTDHSLVPMAARAAGLTLLELLEEIIRLSLAEADDARRGEGA